MLILFLHPHFTFPGGAGKFVLETADRLAQRGQATEILTLAADAAITGRYKHVKIHCVGGPLPNTFPYWLHLSALSRQINEFIDQIKPDILFPQVFPANYWGFQYKSRHGDIPCVWYCQEPSAFVHNFRFILGLKGAIKYAALLSNPLFQWIDRKLVGYADTIIANSNYTAGLVEKIYHRRAAVVYPGVDIEIYKPGFQKEDFIFTAGRLTRFKRVDLIIKALALLRQENVRIRLIVGGDGEETPGLMNLVSKFDLGEQIYFTGRLSDAEVRRYMSTARFVVFPTTNEPFGLVPLEAMACGTPVIVSDSGGPKETVISGKTGLTFQADNVADLADKMRSLWRNNNLTRKMAAAARKNVEERFSWDSTVDMLYKTSFS